MPLTIASRPTAYPSAAHKGKPQLKRNLRHSKTMNRTKGVRPIIFGVIAIIELDDKSHEKVSRIEADAKKGRATAAAGIPLIRWQATALPDETSIRQALAKHMRPTSPSELIA